MPTSQTIFFLLPCEILSTNQCKRFDRGFLFKCSFLPEHHTIATRQIVIFPFPPFGGREKQRWGMGRYLEFSENRVVPRAQDLCQHLATGVCTLLSLAFLSFSAQRLPEDLWRSGSVCELPGPVYCSKLRVSLNLHSHYLSDTSHFLVTPTPVSESSVPLFQCP